MRGETSACKSHFALDFGGGAQNFSNLDEVHLRYTDTQIRAFGADSERLRGGIPDDRCGKSNGLGLVAISQERVPSL